MNIVYKSVVSATKPSEIKFGLNTVYLRKDISEIKHDDETVLWSYQEAALTLDEYKEYSNLAQQNLDNNQLIIMDAIADIYEAIASLSQGGI